MKNMFLILILMFCSSCSFLLYQPDRYLYQVPKDQGFDTTEFMISSKDQTKLGVWFLNKSKNSPLDRKTLITFFHGNAQNVSAHFSILSWIANEGVDVYMGDYRGYGLSEGEPSPKGVYLDVLAHLEESYSRFLKGGYKKFIVYAQSLGGSITMNAIKDFAEIKKIDLLVLDSTFINPKLVAHDKIWGLGYLLITSDYSAENLDHLQMPTIVIHGTNDKVIPEKFGKVVFEELKTPKKWYWQIPNGSHIATFHESKQSYRKKFLEFVDGLDSQIR